MSKYRIALLCCLFLPLFAVGEEVLPQNWPEEFSTSPLPAFGDEKAEEPSFFYALAKTVVVLGVFILLLYGGMWLLRKWTSQSFDREEERGVFRVVARKALSAKVHLYLIDVEGERFLLTESQQGASSLVPLNKGGARPEKRFSDLV